MKIGLEVRQHNALTTARYEYSETQLDVFFYLLSQLRKGQPTAVYEISVPAMSEMTGKQYNYKRLREATKEMGSRCFELETTDELGQKVFRQLWLFKRVDYVIGSGRLRIEFTEMATPFLFELQANFTSFELQAAFMLTSKHAKRIYPLCSQWKDKGETPKFDLTDFKHILGLIDAKGNEEYTKISMFRAKVLEIAVKQINELTDLHIGYRLLKQGRSFESVVFTVRKQSVATPIPFNLVPDSAPSLAGMAPHQVENASRLLHELGIKTPALVTEILASSAHVTACNKFAHDLKTGKTKAKTSRAGLLLTILGLKKPASGPLFEAADK
ncbi:MAG: RepB family plasmid replication initiator protein [Hymenobacter sp.]|nr:MAG: RepB family plasmid replication initiator protein [Hymenobacter sp.]